MMRRILAVGAAALLFMVGAAACEPTPPAEPAMTITAAPNPSLVSCGLLMHVEGTVTPATATPKVVLQFYAGGKWTDVVAGDSYIGAWSLRTANVSKTSGGYSIALLVGWLDSTMRLRVRSSAGSAVSHSMYVKSEGVEGTC